MNALSRLGSAGGGVEWAHRGSEASGFRLSSCALRLATGSVPFVATKFRTIGTPGHLANPNPSQSLDRLTSGLLPSRARELSD